MTESTKSYQIYEYGDKQVVESLLGKNNTEELRHCSYIENAVLVCREVESSYEKALSRNDIHPMVINTVVFLRLIKQLCEAGRKLVNISFDNPVRPSSSSQMNTILKYYNVNRETQENDTVTEQLIDTIINTIVQEKNYINSVTWVEANKTGDDNLYTLNNSGTLTLKGTDFMLEDFDKQLAAAI